ncbi:ATP-binding cassette domain-containing protein [Fibrobacter succinogenes]|uniref:FHA modulated ABC efflux pump with fused ATPase and integral membrane subunits n=1 Tax=Fibrobacter succinogenes TaxID=833 RepID=A0A380RUQ0_FIBSU|nr:ATP-binding cassette domain-containing protein [Fibrobacter succinogenes]PWJ36776.1 FHA modulated ABC efflux pump with fused ATPase and integral membrane subunit [Fibrobacter succinogenes subsp. elongatus]SUQ19025.1 FHA modulated ABC efflux pump with fused ATPase and integral membrane subunits [Fibrobacter succinogenes]
MFPFRLVNPDPSKPFTIGRKSDNVLQFDNLMVSRYHAVLNFTDGKWILQSLTQNSITMLNGKDVTTAILNDGDVILIGPRQLRATLRGADLTLLIMERETESDMQTVTLSTEWREIEIPGIGKAKCRRIVSRDARSSGSAEIKFAKAIVDESGKRTRTITVASGDACRFESAVVGFRNNDLLIEAQNSGFDVFAQNVNVFAGKKQLLKGIDFELPAGEILAIIGRSGQGKSSLLKMIQGINSCDKQSVVRIGGVDYRKNEIRRRIAILPQDPPLRPELTVEETILDGARSSMDVQNFKQDALARLEKFCELFGLSGRKHNLVKTLSGGEMRRVALARELMGNPGLVILDEPLSGLDPYNSRILCTHLKQLAFLGHTIILTTHSYEALQIANKVLVLHQGEEAFFGTVQAAYAHFNTNDPQALLTSITQSMAAEFHESYKHEQKMRESKYYFERTKLPRNFAYTVRITAKQWFRDKGRIAALFVQPAIIGFLLSQIFSDQSSLWTVAFAIILCANWFALSLSIREIVQEKDILRDKFRRGVSAISTLTAKCTLPIIFTMMQTAIVYAFISTRITPHPQIALIACVFACIAAPATTVGLFTSTLSKNTSQANAFLPLLIIPQVALAGALVPLDQMQPIGRALSSVIWSRYNQASLLNILLERKDDIFNAIFAIAIALSFYIVTAILLHKLKKPR